jgi:hypothetical protein
VEVSALTAWQPILNQFVPSNGVGTGHAPRPRPFGSGGSGSETTTSGVATVGWQVGDLLMLSAYFEIPTGTPTGNLLADIAFFDSTGTLISTARAALAMTGATQTIKRLNTAATAVPTDTTELRVRVFVDGSSINVPVGTVFNISHMLLEKAYAGQTVPSVWADMDSNGKVLDVFELGSSASLRAQGSSLPTYVGSFPFTYTDTTLTLGWAGLEIRWPDTGITEIMDGDFVVSGLAANTQYYAYLYFDIVNGGVKYVSPAGAVGTPAIVSTTQDPVADAACKQDGRIPLTPGGLSIITAPTGGSGSGSGTLVMNIRVTPGSVHLSNGAQSQQFIATVTVNGVVTTGTVTWSLSSASLGSIDQYGNYTGPGASVAHGGASVLATSVENPGLVGGASLYW